MSATEQVTKQSREEMEEGGAANSPRKEGSPQRAKKQFPQNPELLKKRSEKPNAFRPFLYIIGS